MRSQTTDVPGRSHHRSPPRSSRPSWARLAILLLAPVSTLAGPATATQQRPVDREPRFYVENVAVEGVRRASPEVIISESLLEAGIAYSEAELRQAVYRVHRLPFVLEAAFSLAKGSERDKYRLLINVEEVRGFFFGSDLSYATYGDTLANASLEDGELTDALTAGMRVFAGQGLFFAAVSDDENLQVGYERYRLSGRPVLLRLAYAREGCCSANLQELGLDPAAAVWTAAEESDRLELTVGVPLGGNQSLRFDASLLETGSAVRRPLDDASSVSSARLRQDIPSAVNVHDVEQRELELAWVFDSTDDPVFPTDGDALTAAIGLRWLEGDLSEPLQESRGVLGAEISVPLSVSNPAAELSSRLVGLSFYGTRHWPLSARQTVSLSMKLLLSRSEVDNIPVALGTDDSTAGATDGTQQELVLMSGDVDSFEADLGARYSLALWGPGKTRRLGELRWETVAGLLYLETSPVFTPYADPLWGVSLSTGIALRNSWGIFRIGLTYLDFDGAV